MTWECRGDTMMDVLMVGLAQLHMNSVLWLTCSPSPLFLFECSTVTSHSIRVSLSSVAEYVSQDTPTLPNHIPTP
eukprot:m.1040270 g.1040270  ORF g.1040270 m.1040270 type:complete len:75 (+) comp24154_c0_seq21:732-956(+)